MCISFGSDLSLRITTSTIKASAPGPGTSQLSNRCKQLTDKTICVDEGGLAKSGKVASIQHKTNAIANCLRHKDKAKAADIQHRKASLEPVQAQPPSSSSPVALLSQSGYKSTGKKLSLCGDAKMPANLLNELNSVLSKGLRSAKTSE